MELQISQLKSSFGEISEVEKQIKNFFELLQQKISKLKQFHSEFVHQSQQSDLFVFGLDSLNFQCKLIDMEFDDLKRIHLAINNRIYCEYYKLYKIIVSYLTEKLLDKKIMELVKGTKFPVYRDLEPYKEYDFVHVVEVHECILLLLSAMHGSMEGKNHELQFHIAKKNIGLNIDNFISSFTFDITMLREKWNLFLAYLQFFHKTHTKQLNRFRNKIQSLYTFVCKDIKFDEALQINSSNEVLLESLPSSRNITETDGSDVELEDTEIIVRLGNTQKEGIVEVEENITLQVVEQALPDQIAMEEPPGVTLEFINSES